MWCGLLAPSETRLSGATAITKARACGRGLSVAAARYALASRAARLLRLSANLEAGIRKGSGRAPSGWPPHPDLRQAAVEPSANLENCF